MIGTEAAAEAEPDGDTLLRSSNSSTVNLPLLRKTPYDQTTLHPIVRVGDGISGFCVHPSTGLKSIKELVDYVKANPGKMPFGTPGPGTSGHMRMEMLSHRAGIKFLHVPYRGGAEVLNDLPTGTVQSANDPTNNASIKAGKLKLLCVNHSTRSLDFADVPTLTEAGYPNSDVPLWFSIWAPAGVPKPIVDALHAKMTEIAKLPETAASAAHRHAAGHLDSGGVANLLGNGHQDHKRAHQTGQHQDRVAPASRSSSTWTNFTCGTGSPVVRRWSA
jgi:tripartite-type tricarboxylate transporter receptor subunit TctC